jgi:hypothetical protein
MFDVFYSGPKPNLFAFEKPARDLDDAAAQCRTGYYWYIYGNVDYTEFDFNYRPVPWESQHVHVWPTQWNQYGGAYLAHVDSVQERKWQFHHTVVKTKASLENWAPSKYSLDFDFSWVPHPMDPPYIYVFGNQWYPAERMPTVEYHVPGATERKYMNYPIAQLAEQQDNHWDTLVDCEWDYSWLPDPGDSPYIYVFGNQWHSPEVMPTVKYTVEGATEIKYMDYPRAKLVQDQSCWTLPDTIDQFNIDFSWVPDPGSPAYVYHFGSEQQETTGLTYTVPGATEIKLAGPAPVLNEDRSATVRPTIFYIDKNNPLAKSRIDGLRDLGVDVIPTRYFGSILDTIKRCANKSKTHLFWVISSENEYTEFDFDWHPSGWQMYMTHVFGSKWNKWTDTFLVNRYELERHSKWAKTLDQFPNLNFVTDQVVTTADDSSAMYFVDHGNPESAPQLASLKQRYPNIRSTRFVDNYLDTFKRIIATATTENVWILSSLCEYDDFDFTWQPGAWEREQIHCFCNERGAWNEERGDTFYIPVEIFKAQMYDLDLLDWFNVISYNASQIIKRWPVPVVEYDGNNLVQAIKDYEFVTPYAVFANREFGQMDHVVDCVWTEKDRTVRSMSTSNGISVIPRDIKKYIKTQVYDYPHLYKDGDGLMNYYADKSLDVVYISNGEPDAERYYKHLVEVLEQPISGIGFPRFSNKIHRVQNVNSRLAAYKAAAHASTTPWFFAVFAKLEVDRNFNWHWQPDLWQEPKHYIFNARNIVNGLEYGHMGMIAYNRNLVLDTYNPGIDFTLSKPHESVPILSGTAHFDQDAWTTWRTAFREVLKLRMFMDTQPTLETEHRLNIWQNYAAGSYAEYCKSGARDAIEYYESVQGDPAKLQLSFEWAWLRDYYNAKYSNANK